MSFEVGVWDAELRQILGRIVSTSDVALTFYQSRVKPESLLPSSNMAAMELELPREEDAQPPRKKFRVTDLPINQAKRSAIDALQHTFKKKGEFDSIRKKVYAQFCEGVSF